MGRYGQSMDTCVEIPVQDRVASGKEEGQVIHRHREPGHLSPRCPMPVENSEVSENSTFKAKFDK